MSQVNQILSHMKSGPITAVEALSLYGCFRLAARINDLRESGIEISTTIIERGGKRFASYSLAGGKQ